MNKFTFHRPKAALVTITCLLGLVTLSACGSESSSTLSTPTETDAVRVQPRSAPQVPAYARPTLPSYAPQPVIPQPVQPVQPLPVQPVQPVQPTSGGFNPNFGNGLGTVLNQSYQTGLDVLNDFNQTAQSPAAPANGTSNFDAEAVRQQAINRQLDNQSHYGNVSDYQRTSIRQSQDYLNRSKAKSYDPAGAP